MGRLVDSGRAPDRPGTEQIQQGDSVALKRDLYVKEGLAFKKGDVVTVVQTGIPKGEIQVRYIVYSSKLRNRLAVSDEVLRKVPGVQSPQGSTGSSPVVQGVVAQQGQSMTGPVSSVIARDITIGGKVAFREGERVTVEGVAPHPQMPDHKYVVLSSALQKRFQLKAEDIRDLNLH